MLRLACALAVGVGLAACADDRPSARAVPPLGVSGQADGLRLTLQAPLLPHAGAYRLPLTLGGGGEPEQFAEPSLSIGAVRYDLADAISPARLSATVDAVQARLAQLLDHEWAATEREVAAKFAGYPECDALKPEQKAGKVQLASNFRFEFPRHAMTFRWCYIVPANAPPALFDLATDFGGVAGMLIRSLSAIEGEFALSVIPAIAGGRSATSGEWLLRPHYAGAIARVSRDLAPVSLFIVRAIPGRTDREYVGLAAAIVQRAATSPLVVQGLARVTAFPSPAAVLVDQDGPLDAKAIAIATLLRTLVPEVGVVLAEANGGYLLGLAIPRVEGDVVIVNQRGEKAGGQEVFVVLDPFSETPVGRVVQPGFASAAADGELSREDLEVIYNLGPGGGFRRFR